MPTKLNDILKTSPGMSVQRPGAKIVFQNKAGYTPKPGDEKEFVGIHSVRRADDRNNNTDDIFKAARIKAFDRAMNRFGYNNHDDEKAEFAADKDKEKQEIATMAEEASAIEETTHTAATRMAQELSDRWFEPHFVHSYTPDYNKPEEKRYGVVSKRHYDNDENRHYRYHLTHIVHPTPPKPVKFNKSSSKVARTMKENVYCGTKRGKNLGYPDGHTGPSTPGQKKTKRFSWLKKVMEGTTIVSKGNIVHDGKHGNPTGVKTAGNDNYRDKAKILPFKKRNEEEEINELSRKTLGSYLSKAGFSANKHSIEAGRASMAGHRDSKNYKKHYARAARHYNKAGNRAVGISMAGEKLAREETVDERVHRRFMPRRTNSKPLPQNDKQINVQDSKNSVNEHLDPRDPAGTYIHDFVYSKNKRFAGKSKAERTRMALGAYYHNRRAAGVQ